jgi:hypothetical protein
VSGDYCASRLQVGLGGGCGGQAELPATPLVRSLASVVLLIGRLGDQALVLAVNGNRRSVT